MNAFEPELGQFGFGNGSDFAHRMQDFVANGLTALGDLVAPFTDKQPWGAYLSPAMNTGQKYANDVFQMRAYCWCDGEREGHEERCPPNFICGDFTASWYKHVHRGNSQSRVLTKTEWRAIFKRCVESLP